MSITKLNNMFAKHGTWGGIIILVIIVVPFVFMTDIGVPDKKNLFSSGDIFGKIGETEIKETDFRYQKMQIELQFPMTYGDKMRPFNRDYSDFAPAIVNRLKILEEAKKYKLQHVSPSEIKEYIKNFTLSGQQKPFMTDGKYDNAKYVAFRDKYVKSRNISNEIFELKLMADQIVISRYYKLFSNAVSSDSIVKQTQQEKFLNRMTSELRAEVLARYIKFDPKAKVDEPKEEDIKKEFEAGKEKIYMEPKIAKLKYLKFERPSDKEVEEYYNNNKDKYKMVKFQQIFFTKTKENTKEMRAKLEECLKEYKEKKTPFYDLIKKYNKGKVDAEIKDPKFKYVKDLTSTQKAVLDKMKNEQVSAITEDESNIYILYKLEEKQSTLKDEKSKIRGILRNRHDAKIKGYITKIKEAGKDKKDKALKEAYLEALKKIGTVKSASYTYQDDDKIDGIDPKDMTFFKSHIGGFSINENPISNTAFSANNTKADFIFYMEDSTESKTGIYENQKDKVKKKLIKDAQVKLAREAAKKEFDELKKTKFDITNKKFASQIVKLSDVGDISKKAKDLKFNELGLIDNDDGAAIIYLKRHIAPTFEQGNNKSPAFGSRDIILSISSNLAMDKRVEFIPNENGSRFFRNEEKKQ